MGLCERRDKRMCLDLMDSWHTDEGRGAFHKVHLQMKTLKTHFWESLRSCRLNLKFTRVIINKIQQNGSRMKQVKVTASGQRLLWSLGCQANVAPFCKRQWGEHSGPPTPSSQLFVFHYTREGSLIYLIEQPGNLICSPAESYPRTENPS